MYEKVRRTTVAKQKKSEEPTEATPSLDKIIEEDAKDEAAYLNEKLEKLTT